MAEDEIKSPTAAGPVPGDLIKDLCRQLGCEPAQVRQIVVDVDRVTIEGYPWRNGRPYMDHGALARFTIVRPIHWTRDG